MCMYFSTFSTTVKLSVNIRQSLIALANTHSLCLSQVARNYDADTSFFLMRERDTANQLRLKFVLNFIILLLPLHEIDDI